MAAATAIGSATGQAVTTTPGNSGDKDISTTRSDTVRVDIANRTGDLTITLQGKDANGNYYNLFDFKHGNNVSIGTKGQILLMLPDTIRLAWVAKSGSGSFDYAIIGRADV